MSKDSGALNSDASSGPKSEDLLDLPGQAFGDGLVADHRALGLAGGPRGEDDVRQLAAVDVDRAARSVGWSPKPSRPGRVDRIAVARVAPSPGATRTEVALVSARTWLPALGRPLRVDGDEGTAGGEDRHHGDHHLGRARHRDGDHLFVRRRPRRAGGSRAGTTRSAKFAIGQPGVAGDDGQSRRGSADLPGEGLRAPWSWCPARSGRSTRATGPSGRSGSGVVDLGRRHVRVSSLV